MMKKKKKDEINVKSRLKIPPPHLFQLLPWSPLCHLELRPPVCSCIDNLRDLSELDPQVEDRQQRMVFVSESERSSEILMSVC